MVYRKNPVRLDELRRLAKERFSGRDAQATTALTLDEAKLLFEELEIHQIELEMQNEHLNAARAQLELALNQNSEQYDFSPVGSLLLDPMGAIGKLNLAAASLLGVERACLLGSRLGLHVPEAQRPVFNALLERARTCGDAQGGEIALARKGLPPMHVYAQVASREQDLGWQVILVDISERQQMEDRLRASEERWKLALESAGDGVWDWNVQTTEVILSRRFEQLYGFAAREYGCRLEDWSSRLHPDDKPLVMSTLQDYLTGKIDSFSMEFRGLCKDGSWKWALSRGAIVSRDEDGKPLRMIGTHVDITRRKKAEEDLAAASLFQQAVFDSLSEQIAVLDRHGVIVQTNTAWRHYALANGCADTPGCIGRNYLDILKLMSGQDLQTVQLAASGIASVAAGEMAHFQLAQPFYAESEKRWFTLKVTPVLDVDARLVVSHEDVTSLKAAERVSWTLANVDDLTGTLSRRNFMNLAEQELSRSTRYELPLMLLMLDLDHFKHVNDTYGHATGDAVLKGFVQTVTDVLRESDLLGRLGGEEFAVLLPNTTLDGGRALAHRIVEAVRMNPIQVNGERVPYTVSIGAGCLSNQTSFAALLAVTDNALYRAKNSGRDCVEVEPT